MKKVRSKQSRTLPKPLLIGVLVVLLMAAGYYISKSDKNSTGSTDDATITQDDSYINLNPPTDEELDETEKYKESLSGQSQQPNDTSGSKKVVPVITNADSTEITAYVPGVFEDGGVCTATLTKGSEVITKTSSGFQNATYTNCTPIDVAGSLSAGSWTVAVDYRSKSASGQSETKTFMVD